MIDLGVQVRTVIIICQEKIMFTQSYLNFFASITDIKLIKVPWYSRNFELKVFSILHLNDHNFRCAGLI